MSSIKTSSSPPVFRWDIGPCHLSTTCGDKSFETMREAMDYVDKQDLGLQHFYRAQISSIIEKVSEKVAKNPIVFQKHIISDLKQQSRNNAPSNSQPSQIASTNNTASASNHESSVGSGTASDVAFPATRKLLTAIQKQWGPEFVNSHLLGASMHTLRKANAVAKLNTLEKAVRSINWSMIRRLSAKTKGAKKEKRPMSSDFDLALEVAKGKTSVALNVDTEDLIRHQLGYDQFGLLVFQPWQQQQADHTPHNRLQSQRSLNDQPAHPAQQQQQQQQQKANKRRKLNPDDGKPTAPSPEKLQVARPVPKRQDHCQEGNKFFGDAIEHLKEDTAAYGAKSGQNSTRSALKNAPRIKVEESSTVIPGAAIGRFAASEVSQRSNAASSHTSNPNFQALASFTSERELPEIEKFLLKCLPDGSSHEPDKAISPKLEIGIPEVPHNTEPDWSISFPPFYPSDKPDNVQSMSVGPDVDGQHGSTYIRQTEDVRHDEEMPQAADNLLSTNDNTTDIEVKHSISVETIDEAKHSTEAGPAKGADSSLQRGAFFEETEFAKLNESTQAGDHTDAGRPSSAGPAIHEDVATSETQSTEGVKPRESELVRSKTPQKEASNATETTLHCEQELPHPILLMPICQQPRKPKTPTIKFSVDMLNHEVCPRPEQQTR